MPLRGKVRAAPQVSIQCRAFCCFICFHCPVKAAYSPSCNSFTYAAAYGCVREPNIPSRIPAGKQYRSWKFRFFRFSGQRTDGLWRSGGHAAGPMRRLQSPKTSPFSLCTPPLHPLAYPQSIWMDVRRSPPSPSPLHLPLPPSARTVASSEPKRSTPAPCSWGLGA